MLPQDPNILLSYINTKLRDQYPSLEALCEDLDVTKRTSSRPWPGWAMATIPDAINFCQIESKGGFYHVRLPVLQDYRRRNPVQQGL